MILIFLKYFIVLFLLCFSSVQAETMKVAVSDSFIQLKNMNTLIETMGDEFYNIEDFLVKRVELDDIEYAVGIANLVTHKRKCRSFLIITNGKVCDNTINCRLTSKIINCGNLPLFLDQFDQ